MSLCAPLRRSRRHARESYGLNTPAERWIPMFPVKTSSRIDRVFALFAPSQATLAAECAMDRRISTLIGDFLRTRGVAAPVDLAELAEGFSDSDLPDEPMAPAEFVEHLAEDVVP